MNAEALARSTFVLNRSTAEQLSYISRRMGVSRSALVREVLTAPVEQLASMVRQVPDNPTPQDVRQLALAGLDAFAALSGPELAKLRELSGHE